MIRKPVVAGQFYPGTKELLLNTLDSFLLNISPDKKINSMLAMLPHAGYMYSGKTAGKTISYALLKENIILLGPNHTGLGENFAVWDKGRWEFPGGYLEVNEDISNTLIQGIEYLKSDTTAHIREHSLEVLIPFLWRINPGIKIIPICIMESDLDRLLLVGKEIADLIIKNNYDVSLVVSSDMSHFISHYEAMKKDKLAIDAILELDPIKLYKTVRLNNITMCGVFPMTVGLEICNRLGANNATLIDYTTSGEVSGDMSHVVGYAGILIS